MRDTHKYTKHLYSLLADLAFKAVLKAYGSVKTFEEVLSTGGAKWCFNHPPEQVTLSE
jgi:hypothetical protein